METYYIIKILKIKELTETVKKVADTHHHHKLILYFQIPKFEESEEQVKIAELAIQYEGIIQKYVKVS